MPKFKIIYKLPDGKTKETTNSYLSESDANFEAVDVADEENSEIIDVVLVPNVFQKIFNKIKWKKKFKNR